MATPGSSLPIVWRADAHPTVYEQARVGRVFNQRRPQRFPLAVVEASEEAHIVAAVQLAVQQGCRVSVRSGGHSWAAWSVRDEAILIDLGQYRLLEIDEAHQTATVSPSTTGRILNAALDDKGLMFAGGHCPDVGLGGFLLQGGMGWNCKNWGFACEQVLAVDVVTAAGDLIHCSATEHADLYWAARGAGPGFPGIVTKFHLALRPKYAHMLSSTFIYAVADYRRAMDWVLGLTPTYDRDTEIVAVGATPPGMAAPCIIVHFVTFKHTLAAAEAALDLANRTHPPGALVELPNQPTSLAKEYRDQAAANPENHRYCAENAYINDDADVAAVLEPAFTSPPPHPKAFSLWFAMAPGSNRPKQQQQQNPTQNYHHQQHDHQQQAPHFPDMALSMQSAHYFALYTVWEEAADDARCLAWTAAIMKDVERHSAGAYLGDADFQVRGSKFWADDHAARLMRIRRHWDPHGTVCGYLDQGDASGVNGLANRHEWLRDE